MNEKRCPRCKESKPVSEFGKNANRRDGLQVYCRVCHKAQMTAGGYNKRWYDNHVEEQRERSKERYWANPQLGREKTRQHRQKHPDRVKASAKKSRERVKKAVLDAYGGTCVCCGEVRLAFLTIDHIDGCSIRQRKKEGMGSDFYRRLYRDGFPPGVQVLCFNCNLGRKVNGGVCPHAAQ